MWLGTDNGAYRVEGNIPKLISDCNLRINNIQNINDRVCLTTNNDLYRVDEDVTIAVDLDSKGLWWKLINKISPWKVWVSPLMPKPCYTRIVKIAGIDPSSSRG